MFTENANRIFERAIADYHRRDDVDQPMENPFEAGSIDALLYHKCWIDTVQWHLEDIIRDPKIDPVEALKIKRRIDRSNQDRTDMVEYIDSYLLDKYREIRPSADARRPRPYAPPRAPCGKSSGRGSTGGRWPTPGSRC